LCYRDCNIIGMANCGQGACTADGMECALKIGEMAISVFEGVATGVSTILSGGASAPARTSAKLAAKTALKALSKEGLNAALQAVKNALKGKFKDALIEKAKNKAIVKIKDQIKSTAQVVGIQSICETLYKTFQSKTITTPSVQDLGGKILDSLDVFGVKNTFTSCSSPESDGGASCAKAVVEGLSAVDPTGVLTIAAAFIHPSCDVPVSKPKGFAFGDFEQDYSADVIAKMILENKSKETYDQLLAGKNKCIVAFDQPFLKGNKFEICASTPSIKNAQGVSFNKKIASFIAGSEVTGYFFDENDYNGNFVTFKKSDVVNDVTSIGANNFISSIWLGGDDIVSIVSTVGSLANKYQNFMMTPGRRATFTKGLRTQSKLIRFWRPSGRKVECVFSNNKASVLNRIFENKGVNEITVSNWTRDQIDSCIMK
jgi:hypothetical protein